jgi:hypothetical protein
MAPGVVPGDPAQTEHRAAAEVADSRQQWVAPAGSKTGLFTMRIDGTYRLYRACPERLHRSPG